MSGFGIYAAIGLLVAGAANVLYYRWLVRRVRGFQRAGARAGVRAALVLAVVVPFCARVWVYFGGPERLVWVEGLGLLWVMALVLSLPLIAALEALARVVAEPPADPARRDAAMAIAGNVVVGAATLPLAWGIARTRFDVEVVELPIRIPRLPKSLDGFSIVQVSDVHVGAYLGERDLRRAEEMVRKLRPDLVAMTGDLVHARTNYLPLAMEWLVRLRAMSRFGLLGILGNHEYYVGRAAVADAYRRAGLELLVNEARLIAPNDGGIGFAGVDDYFARTSGRGGGPRLDLVSPALAPDKARILLCHQPQLHPHSAAADMDLQLSGHTHGGQIAPLGPLAVRMIYGHFSGYTKRDGCHLYVNRGLGTSGPPSRVAVRPEITKIVLVAG